MASCQLTGAWPLSSLASVGTDLVRDTGYLNRLRQADRLQTVQPTGTWKERIRSRGTSCKLQSKVERLTSKSRRG